VGPVVESVVESVVVVDGPTEVVAVESTGLTAVEPLSDPTPSVPGPASEAPVGPESS
jgi:hypothetical protein